MYVFILMIYLTIYFVYVCMYLLKPYAMNKMRNKSIFQRSGVGFNSEFSLSYTVYCTWASEQYTWMS